MNKPTIRTIMPKVKVVKMGVFAVIGREFYASYRGSIFRFRNRFDDVKDEYQDIFTIFAILEASEEDFASGRFYNHSFKEIPIGVLQVDEVYSSTRTEFTSSAFEMLADGYLAGQDRP